VSGPEPAPGPAVDLLLETVRRFVAETIPALRSERIGLDSRFEADLGLDSLARVELLRRIEAALEVDLPEEALVAETLEDLLRLAPRVGAAPPQEAAEAPALPPTTGGEPVDASTLIEAFRWHCGAHRERVHLLLYGEGEDAEPITYGELWDAAASVAAGLRAHGLAVGETVAVMLPTGLDYFTGFFGILLAGGVPVPIYPPTRPSQLEEHLRRHARILDNAGTAYLVTVAAAKGVAALLQAEVPALRKVLIPADLTGHDPLAVPEARADDLAFLQYTSGSTGDPKGVMLSHRQLLANIRAMGRAAEVRPDDVFVSWLPLYHDMGLIGAWLGSLYYGLPLVVMSPLSFLARPARWLRAIHRHRGTLSAAPNFAYELCLSKVADTQLAGLDLSSWRRAFNGAEPVSPVTLERFAARFSAYGLRPEALAPVYGLAEAAVGLAFPPAGRGPIVERVRREAFRRDGRAEPAPPGDANALRFVACGRPLPGYAVRVVDAGGRALPDRQEGRLQFVGPSATDGYFRNPGATQRLFQDGWLDTGDRAYLADGEIFVTGRVKDLVIRGGRNFYPYDLEEAVGTIKGIRKGCVVVFGTRDPSTGSERVVVVAETRERDADRLAGLRRAVRERSLEVLGLPPDDVVLVRPHAVLKTSSGKLRRGAVRELYEAGTLGVGAKALWRQLASVIWRGLSLRSRRLLGALRAELFSGYAWTVFGLLALVTWVGVLVLPRSAWRWAVVRGAIRTARVITGTGLSVDGAGKVPAQDRPLILVANHASFLDALALIEAVPRPLCFVAKRELGERFYLRWPLLRLGTLFVERFDVQRSAREAVQLAEAVGAGRSLAFFPEGTFRDAPGLLPFRMGAFQTAAETGVPILPVALRGTRQILGGNSLKLRRGTVRVLVTDPLSAEGPDWRAAVALRDKAREWILRHCGEPDLLQEQPRGGAG